MNSLNCYIPNQTRLDISLVDKPARLTISSFCKYLTNSTTITRNDGNAVYSLVTIYNFPGVKTHSGDKSTLSTLKSNQTTICNVPGVPRCHQVCIKNYTNMIQTNICDEKYLNIQIFGTASLL